MISVKSNTPFFGRMLTQQDVLSRGDRAYWCTWFFKKIFKFLVLVRVRVWYKPSLVFRLSLVLSMYKFSAGIQLFGLKTTSHGKSDLKIHFWGRIRGAVTCWVRFRVTGYRDSLYSNISPFSAGIQHFGLKTTSHGKYNLNKREILSVACGIQAFEGSVSSWAQYLINN